MEKSARPVQLIDTCLWLVDNLFAGRMSEIYSESFENETRFRLCCQEHEYAANFFTGTIYYHLKMSQNPATNLMDPLGLTYSIEITETV